MGGGFGGIDMVVLYALAGAFGGVLALVIIIVCATFMCKLAEKKGYDAKAEHIFALCFWLGGFGWLYTVCLPDLVKREQLAKLAGLATPRKPVQPKVEEEQK